METLFVGGTRDGQKLEVDEDIQSVLFSSLPSKEEKYSRVEIVVSIQGTAMSVDVMVTDGVTHMKIISKFLTYTH